MSAEIHDLFDLEAIERMVALTCATFSAGEGASAQLVLAMGASYLEFIDPLADPDFEKCPVGKNGKFVK